MLASLRLIFLTIGSVRSSSIPHFIHSHKFDTVICVMGTMIGKTSCHFFIEQF